MVHLEQKEQQDLQSSFTFTLDLIEVVFARIAEWALAKEFANYTMNDILSNWKAWLECHADLARGWLFHGRLPRLEC